MRLAALCLISAMFPVSLHALTADEMVLKPPLELERAWPTTVSQELYIFGLSYHSDRDYGYNEQNPGLGYGIEIFNPTDKPVNMSILASMGTYKDSYSEQAYFVVAGPRLTLGHKEDWHFTFSAQFGYMDGSGIKGAVGLPMASINYSKVGIGITGNPSSIEQVVGVFLKFNIDTN